MYMFDKLFYPKKFKTADKEVDFVRTSDCDRLLKHVKANGRLRSSSLEILVGKSKFDDVVIYYMNNDHESFKVSEVQEALFTKGSPKLVIAFINKIGDISPSAEDSFIKWRDNNEIIAYIKRHSFSKFGFNMLIKNGNHLAIMTHLERHYIYDNDVAVSIIQRGNHDEIMLLIGKKKFDINGEISLIERGVIAEITAYLEKYGFCNEAIKTMLDRGVHEEIMILLKELQTDNGVTNFVIDALLKRGNEEELLLIVQNELDKVDTLLTKILKSNSDLFNALLKKIQF